MIPLVSLNSFGIDCISAWKKTVVLLLESEVIGFIIWKKYLRESLYIDFKGFANYQK